MDQHWRLAFMFDAREGDLGGLEDGLRRSGAQVRRLAGDAAVRLGVADRHPDLAVLRQIGEVKLRGVDGVVEVSVAGSRAAELPGVARALREALDDLAAPGSIETMAGPMFHMVPVRDGGAFISLAFKRFPGMTSQQFLDWWLHQHSAVAIPVLGADLLAYDQVHVDLAATQAVSRAAEVDFVPYDAYDNLTWKNRDAFLRSTGDTEGMARVFADEVGHIDNPSRRNALMLTIG
jgi:hypothetical protein